LGCGLVLFVPANVPPHKQKQPMTAFVHRYAMVALATEDQKQFVPSLLEAPAELRSAATDRSPIPTTVPSIPCDDLSKPLGKRTGCFC